jgi:hypothetical protein
VAPDHILPKIVDHIDDIHYLFYRAFPDQLVECTGNFFFRSVKNGWTFKLSTVNSHIDLDLDTVHMVHIDQTAIELSNGRTITVISTVFPVTRPKKDVLLDDLLSWRPRII